MYQPKFTTGKFLSVPKNDNADRINLIIGDDKQPDFEPQLKICRWDNEVNFPARLVHNEKNPKVTQDGNKVVWKGQKVEAHFYDLDDTKTPEGGHEFEVHLLSKPDTNVVSFTIEPKGLDFFYQPELTDEEKAKGAKRPENVVGSYAVYYENGKSGDYSHPSIGGKNYRAGKAFHIYRPNATDANGNTVWGDLNIDTENGLMTMTFPQDFLDNAAYPVVVDPTFGYTSIGATMDSNVYLADYNHIVTQRELRFGSYYTMPETGMLDKITAYLSSYNNVSSAKLKALINQKDSDGSGLHGQITMIENDGVDLSSATWIDFIETGSIALTSGIVYILNLAADSTSLGSSGTVYLAYDSGSNSYMKNDDIVFSSLPDPWSSPNSTSHILSIYATYTATGTNISVSDNGSGSDSISKVQTGNNAGISDYGSAEEEVAPSKQLDVEDQNNPPISYF